MTCFEGGRQIASGFPDVAGVAPRVVQFAVPPAAVRRGHNTVEVGLEGGQDQKVIWVEILIAPL